MNQKRKDRIQNLSERLKQLQAQQTRADLRQRAIEGRKARKEDTRRKVLAGTLVLTCLEDGRLSKTDFYAWLDQALVRPEDRALFDLADLRNRATEAGALNSETKSTVSDR